ncbi:gluconate kinase [Thermobifida fusca YX]|jgi:gluconokinase|uniref:Gluconokinase n=2 Tax=Thermobifida fusca TaxID=2021 RepID=A0A9P2TAH2_THEFU|nr:MULTISPECIES: gluconokinase [Thermobifida]AAZ56147.1 gluconate kinase [Thermobifida fusca YX]EOR70750.1 gluconate kinase [Thermobifida fusca TM51]MBO2530220.1 gluconate kinase [Thermobifida sp.]PPS94338.1 gluconate kinase [Thermobifida fusca]PZN63928.1 MAG: gluconokinase [Thermobifida fusca]
MHYVFMGVSGSGKTTVARGVAQELGLPFADADDFHPEANIAKMARGIPLTDEDRLPWLQALAAWISEREREGTSSVVTCSALRRSYRDLLRRSAPGVFFLHLHGSAELIGKRIRERRGHFMPPQLLDSQFATLEPLAPDEAGAVLDVSASPEDLIAEAVRIVTGLRNAQA